VRAGLRGIEVDEIVLLPHHRGRALGAALSVALAQHVRLPKTEFLLGTAHWNTRSARSAGRSDRGGEIVVVLAPQPSQDRRLTCPLL
jgi:hypothetical protein